MVDFPGRKPNWILSMKRNYRR